MHRQHVFAGPYLDRAAHRREDPDWLEAARADPASRIVAVWNSRHPIAEGEVPHAAFLPLDGIAPPSLPADPELILLGRREGTHYFAFEFAPDAPPTLPPGTRFEDLRQIAALLPADEAGLLGYARAMLAWRQRHRFCGSCGSATQARKGGHVRHCINPACGAETFPRIDPAIIVLVSDGERALLGRQATWPERRYSTIAGFVEPGEALEDAVAREVYEETGVEVGAIEYQSSQPWPFPSSLMLGFTAQARSLEVRLRDRELEDARWFSRTDIANGALLLPPVQSISYRLIEQWFDAGHDGPLRSLGGSR